MKKSSDGVLIVGAGPTGLALAIELQRRGISHRLIERDVERHQQSRATDIQPRTLEVFQDMGVVDAFLAAGQRRTSASIRPDGRLLVRIVYADADTPFNFALGLVQHETQRLLEDRLEALGGRVERGVRLAHLHQTRDSVSTTLLYADQRWEELSFRWAIGCDGARSMVRRSMGIPFDGSTFEESFFLADIDLGSEFADDEVVLISSPRGMAVVLPLGPGRLRVIGDLDPGFEDALDDATCVALIQGRLGDDVKITNVGWRSTFSINTRMVSQYRKGRVLLCGDAAHIHSPITGHGMNCGIQDAYNLGWKLALVEGGQAHEQLVDSYHAERHPIAKTLLAETDIQTSLMLSRNRIAHGAMAALGQLAFSLDALHRRFLATCVELDVAYAGSPIVGELRGSLFTSPLLRNSEFEGPSVADHRSFSAGPGPGVRAPDLTLGHTSVFELLSGVEHTLLLFDGLAVTEDGYVTLTDIANTVTATWTKLIRVHVVVLGDAKPAGLQWSGSSIFDPEGALHRRYGATAECLYLIRPDGYVGFRSQPAELAAVEHYMSRLLK